MTDYRATPERWQNIENAVEIASRSIQWVVSAVNWSPEARAAIREVLAYLCEHELIGNYARQQLEQEVGV